MENPQTYYCFVRTWWKPNKSWPDGREPSASKGRTIRKNLSHDEAIQFCKEWNASHNPGKWSKKCEFDEQRR